MPRRNGVQQLKPVPHRRDFKLLQSLMRQARKNRLINFVFAECLLVLFETKAPQPHCQVHDSALVARSYHQPRATSCLSSCSGLQERSVGQEQLPALGPSDFDFGSGEKYQEPLLTLRTRSALSAQIPTTVRLSEVVYRPPDQ